MQYTIFASILSYCFLMGWLVWGSPASIHLSYSSGDSVWKCKGAHCVFSIGHHESLRLAATDRTARCLSALWVLQCGSGSQHTSCPPPIWPYWGLKKIIHILQHMTFSHFQMHSLERKFLYFVLYFHEICSKGPYWISQYCFTSDNLIQWLPSLLTHIWRVCVSKMLMSS